MSNLSDLKKKYEELGEEIYSLESDKYVLKLRVNLSNELCIGFENKTGKYVNLGLIGHGGSCFILSNFKAVERYNKWRENGMKVDDTVVDWRGGSYQIDNCGKYKYILTRTDIMTGCIYNLDECESEPGCGDENIRRFEHNNRPIIF